ncbi:MAG: HAMP domain-containing histidine kinase [Bacteroidales bacterium]|nr:HAMP domain-containing histidine kinase [Bacteroidales bacterium]
MSRKVLTIIIILSTISLVAAIITQLLWVRDAWQLKEDQFNDRVKIGLKSVVHQLLSERDYYQNKDIPEIIVFADSLPDNLLERVPPKLLDSLLQKEFDFMRISEEFVYGVLDTGNLILFYGIYGGYQSEISKSPHWVSLDCLCINNDFQLKVFFPMQNRRIMSELLILPVMSGLFLLILMFSFFFTIYFIIRQKKLNEMKTDFVNNMTHEFKTPISTISVSSEMLMKSGVNESPEKVSKYANIIFDENTRLKNQVEKVLQIAILDRKDFRLKMKDFNAHEVVRESIRSFNILVGERGGVIHEHLSAEKEVISADKLHFSNIINNLIDNANKYSAGSPEITITSRNHNGHLIISVEDKGIGISKDNTRYIFRKFHRVQTGNLHDVKGFGLGLYYVKTITEAMGGSINVRSELNKGSRFDVSFPVMNIIETT